MSLTALLPYLPSIIGAAGTFLDGGQETNLPPELKNLMDMLRKRSEEGLGNLDELKGNLTQRLGNEFEALSSLTNQNLTKSGAGVGVQNAVRSELSGERFNALGQGFTNLDVANEGAKESALSQLGQLQGLVPSFTRDKSQGYSDLFGSGFNLLLEQRNQDLTRDLLAKYLKPSYSTNDISNARTANNAMSAITQFM